MGVVRLNNVQKQKKPFLILITKNEKRKTENVFGIATRIIFSHKFRSLNLV